MLNEFHHMSDSYLTSELQILFYDTTDSTDILNSGLSEFT